MPKKGSIGIIGGGISGLSFAFFLVQGGYDGKITIYEKNVNQGGKIRHDILGGHLLEEGADSIVLQNEITKDLILDLFDKSQLIKLAKRGFCIINNGKQYFVPSGTAQLLQPNLNKVLDLNLLSDKGKADYLNEYKIAPLAEDESIQSFITRRFGAEMYHKLAGPLYSGLLGVDLDLVSIKAAFPVLKKLEVKYGSILKAAEHILNNQKQQNVISFSGGMISLINAIKNRISQKVSIVDASVSNIKYDKGYILTTQNGNTFFEDTIIMTTPANISATLLAQAYPKVGALLNKILHQSMASVHFLISTKSIKKPLDSTGVIISREDQKSISACSWSSIKWSGRAKKETVLVRAFVRKRNYLNKSDQELISHAWADISDVMNISDKPLNEHIYRWNNCMPVYGMSHMETINQIDALTADKSLYFLGASFRGVGVGSCISNAHRLSQAFL